MDTLEIISIVTTCVEDGLIVGKLVCKMTGTRTTSGKYYPVDEYIKYPKVIILHGRRYTRTSWNQAKGEVHYVTL